MAVLKSPNNRKKNNSWEKTYISKNRKNFNFSSPQFSKQYNNSPFKDTNLMKSFMVNRVNSDKKLEFAYVMLFSESTTVLSNREVDYKGVHPLSGVITSPSKPYQTY